MSKIAKLSPLVPRTILNGESPLVGSLNRNTDSGFLNISYGP